MLMLLAAVPAASHEVRPAYLHAQETSSAQFKVIWKQPIIEGKRLKITPTFPPDCAEGAGARDIQTMGATVTEQYTILCSLTRGEIRLEGLERTLTDAFVRIDYLDGSQVTSVIKPASPSLNLGSPPPSPTLDYIKIGVDHIIYGWDHLLFVMGLVMLVGRRQIIGVATAFTAAHSLTLALAALGILSVPTRPVEILIAMSIVLLGVEIIRKTRGVSSIAARRPYLISFVIGLIHGCGFASALSDIGLPKGTELLALLLFNLGVELGQVAIIALLLVIIWGASKIFSGARRGLEIGTAYSLGIVGVFWAVQRLSSYLWI